MVSSLKEKAKKTAVLVIKTISFLFCFTLGCLSLYVFAVAAAFLLLIGLGIYIKISIPVEKAIEEEHKPGYFIFKSNVAVAGCPM